MNIKQSIFAAKRATVLRSSWETFAELQRHDAMSSHELEQLERARSLAQARFAYESSVFYRELYDSHGIARGDLDDPEVWHSLPVVTKDLVREHHDDLRTSEWTSRRAYEVTTGGSTGQPMAIDRDLRVPVRAFEWRMQSWWGVAPYDDWAIIYRRFRSRGQRIGQKVLWWPTRRDDLDAYDMTPATMRAFAATLERRRPAFLFGYVGAIVEFARFVLESGISVPAPTAIAVTAAPLLSEQRQMIQDALGAPVYDHYRSTECNWMAGECRRQDGLHVFSDIRKLELLSGSGQPVPDGVSGEVVVTEFTNRVFPLVRYRLGDVTHVLPEPCSCGLPYPRIAPIVGRTSDAFRLPSGKVVPGESLTGIFRSTIGMVEQFQLRQRADAGVTVRYVPIRGRSAPPDLDLVAQRLRSALNDEVPIDYEQVDAIAHDGGKIRYVISEYAT
jgi:phenylacetate-CoA ligase